MSHVINVFPAGRAWEIVRASRDDVVESFTDRSRAIEWALELARREHSHLRIYDRDHTVVEEFTFGEEPAFFEFG